jgi:PadR family transcriptional regulator PadR
VVRICTRAREEATLSNIGWLTQMKKGLLELCILNLLERESMHGYQLVKVLRNIPGLVVTEGTIYPLLGRLKKENLVIITFEESSTGPIRKNYKLSAEGKRRLKEMNRLWKEMSEVINESVLGDETITPGEKKREGSRK